MFDEPDLVRRIATRTRDAECPARVGCAGCAWLVALLYLASLALPVGRDVYGFAYFLCGGFMTLLLLPVAPFALLGSLLGDPSTRLVGAKDLGLYLPWLANPVLWVGLRSLARGRPRQAAAAGAVALPLALAFLLTEPGDLRAGYYAWAGSMTLLLVAGLAGASVERGAPVRRLPDAGPKFAAARVPLPGRGHGVQRPTEPGGPRSRRQTLPALPAETYAFGRAAEPTSGEAGQCTPVSLSADGLPTPGGIRVRPMAVKPGLWHFHPPLGQRIYEVFCLLGRIWRRRREPTRAGGYMAEEDS